MAKNDNLHALRFLDSMIKQNKEEDVKEFLKTIHFQNLVILIRSLHGHKIYVSL